ncbi:MAG: VOC family protein [bacterium]|nr:VOC family protein [bacterium]
MSKIIVGWVEIPVADMERAVRFYGALFDAKFDIIEGGVRRVAILTAEAGAVGVSLNHTANFEPGSKGLYVSFAAGNEIDALLARAEAAGGRVTVRRGELLLPNNYFASVQDTEGNVFGLVWAEQA